MNVIHLKKKQLVPTNANLAMVFICKLFQSSLQVGQLVSYGNYTGLDRAKTIAVFLTRVQHFAETLLSSMRRGKRQ